MNREKREQIGVTLRAERRKLGVSCEVIAPDVGISHSTISLIERGFPNVSEEMIIKYASHFGLSKELLNVESEVESKERTIHSHLKRLEKLIIADTDSALERLEKLNSEENLEELPSFSPFIHFYRGLCNTEKKKWKAAVPHLISAIKLIDKVQGMEKSNIKAVCYNELGKSFHFQNDLIKALEYNELGLKEYTTDGDRETIKHNLMINQVIYLDKLGRKQEEALQTLDELREDLKKCPFHKLQSNVVLQMYVMYATILNKQNMYQKALDYAKQGIEFAKQNREFNNLVSLQATLGSIHLKKGDLALAEECYLQSLEFKNKIRKDKEYLLIPAYTELGLLYTHQKKWNLAEKELKNAIKISKSSDDALGQIEALLVMGNCCIKQQMMIEAIPLYKKAVNLAKQHNHKIKERQALLYLSYCYSCTGNDTEFTKHKDEFYNVNIHIELGV
ncbi:tetratricopeptide repeat protein [Shimazuella sp. AN120528]|uniref:helix-turn-helix domain-containing protein n=1 Tax=Shimazuella soli TaxID=1892854 RepID=UPI001F1102A0|nr:tetratricopeptide repeat protein [Shimazuella soli]MCH5584433.1 tetratricopeptide repeat protein [Shimazuella soli]